MKSLQFNFSTLSVSDKTVRTVTGAFSRAGVPVVVTDVDKSLSRKSGITYKSVNFTFADGQRLTMNVKATGDVFEVRLNGKPLPLRNQDDYTGAIKEIADRLDKARAAFQKSLARVKVPLPPSVKVSRAKMLEAKVQKRDALKEAVGLAKQTLAKLNGQPVDEPA